MVDEKSCAKSQEIGLRDASFRRDRAHRAALMCLRPEIAVLRSVSYVNKIRLSTERNVEEILERENQFGPLTWG